MKTFIILLLLTFALNTNAQIGAHFADSNAIWKTNYVWLPPGPYGYNAYAENSISGDTTINDLLYKKIKNTGYDVFCTDIITSAPIYVGALREDTIQKKVFFIPNGEQHDTLLYNYNLQVGDTLHLSYNVHELAGQIFVFSIDTIETNGIQRMRWNLSAEYYGQFASIIEGIGSTTGLLEEIWAFEEGAYLRCYVQNDTLVYLNASQCKMPTDTCYYLNISENSNKIDVLYRPNPVDNWITISLENNRIENYTIDFYNQLGNKVKSIIVSNSERKINVENLSSGLYYLVARKRDIVVNSQKIIKK